VGYRGGPILVRSIDNVVMESDANANIKPNKKSSDKIDLAVPAPMAFCKFHADHEYFTFDISNSHKQRLAAFQGI
jgi:phage terminase large subunit-like protein